MYYLKLQLNINDKLATESKPSTDKSAPSSPDPLALSDDETKAAEL